jgi:transcriptional regulator with XRE-family HTH domain
MDIQKRVGRNVKKLRRARRLSQEEFSFNCGLHRTYVSDIERGARNPTVRVLQKLADALGVEPETLLKKDPD